jgi:hypothetical protein
MNKKELKKQEAKKSLLENYIKPDTILLIVIKSVAQSGMTRRMQVYSNGGISNITYLIADLCDLSVNYTGLKIQGCGMDMTFWLADYITKVLYWEKDDDYNTYQEKIKTLNLKGDGNTCLDWRVL